MRSVHKYFLGGGGRGGDSGQNLEDDLGEKQ